MAQRPAEPRTALVVTRAGEVRLSPDLVPVTHKFWPSVDLKVGEIVLHSKSKGHQGQARNVYFTNKRAKSGRISLVSEIRELGFTTESLWGVELPAKLEKDGSVRILVVRKMRGV